MAGDLIRPPRTRPASLSLESSAPTTPPEEDVQGRWEMGYSFAPLTCSGAGVADPCASSPRVIEDRPGVVEGEPFIVWAGDRCSTFGFVEEEYEERARQLLLNCQSSQIARELWEGTLATAAGWPNRFLASSSADTLTNGPTAVIAGLACLEQALASCSCGRRGMIHATPQVVTHWASMGAGVLRREGGLLLTVHDTIVVSDGGYTGTGPEGQAATDSIWAYATGMVEVRLGDIAIVPGEFSMAVDRADNTVEFYAERPATAFWDGCCHFAVELDLEACLIAGWS